jgi:SAM-dependent methyltransferase
VSLSQKYEGPLGLTVRVYDHFAEEFQRQYLSTTTVEVHGAWLRDYLPTEGAVLDVGAGVGRDARFFAEKGLSVVAVDPAPGFVRIGAEYTEGLPVRWLVGELPDLDSVFALEEKFELVLLSAVWMHIHSQERDRAFGRLSDLLKPGGVLVITLRHGSNSDEREMFDVSVEEVNRLAEKYGLKVFEEIASDDTLGRSEVFWETVVVRKAG